MPIVDSVAEETTKNNRIPQKWTPKQEELEFMRTEFTDMGADTEIAPPTRDTPMGELQDRHKPANTAQDNNTPTAANFKSSFQKIKHLMTCATCSSMNSLLL
ncbi:unnamed protein product, partial [Agarophyton chilense]